MDHKKWTDILPEAIRRALKEDFNETFSHPILREIESNMHTTDLVRTHVLPQMYGLLLQRMHCSGILVWMPKYMRTTPLSQHSDRFCMTFFAINKHQEHEGLISWPRQVNKIAPEPPRPYFPKPRHF